MNGSKHSIDEGIFSNLFQPPLPRSGNIFTAEKRRELAIQVSSSYSRSLLA